MSFSSSDLDIYIADIACGEYILSIKLYNVDEEVQYALGGIYIEEKTEEITIKGDENIKNLLDLSSNEEDNLIMQINKNQKRVFQEEEDIQVIFDKISDVNITYEIYQKQNNEYQIIKEKEKIELPSSYIFSYPYIDNENKLTKGTYRFVFSIDGYDMYVLYNIIII